ncbi:MAG: ATP-binding protein [Deltaproteobacteria bacterium]|nr:ATP-binding protein [Deltaproteobacteria bacterium]
MLHRYLTSPIQQDALTSQKMAFISGPRQVGKTSLAQELLTNSENYFNWDDAAFAKAWVKNPESALNPAHPGPVVIDEIHKYRFWKKTLKGMYDKHKDKFNFIITGSARLDLYQKGGDSLLGRYYPYRLYPFTVSETATPTMNPENLEPNKINYPLKDLLQLTGFPDPLLQSNAGQAERWSRLRKERLLREDIRDFKNIRELQLMRILIEILPEKIGSPLSINSLREDLQISYSVLRDWIEILKNLYICFQIPPYHKKIARSLVKESKYYLYDWIDIKSDGAKLENVVALHLLKACHFWTDCAVGTYDLYYIRTLDKLEIDFCITKKGEPWMLVECKSNDLALSPALIKMHRLFPKAKAIQLTLKNIDKVDLPSGIRIINVEKFLSLFM